MPSNDKRVVEVIKRSGFDKSFRNTLTGKCGTLVPILVDEVIPDTKVNLRINLAASMAPLVSDTYMNVRLRVEAFAVPHRLLQNNFEDFFNDYPDKVITSVSGSTFSDADVRACVPLIRVHSATTTEETLLSAFRQRSTLYDYCSGGKMAGNQFNFDYPVAVFELYHLIWQEWYRNPRVQKPAFMRYSASSYSSYRLGTNGIYAFNLPFCSYGFDSNGNQPVIVPNTTSGVSALNNYLLADGVNILSLRQRNFGLDYFTAAMVSPQQGDMAHVVVPSVDMPSGITGFTIAALRASNSIQQFRERNNLTSPRYQQQIYARYGVAPSDGVIQRPVLIGAGTYDVYSHGVTATTSTDSPVAAANNFNPFAGAIGQRSGNAFASGSDFIISNFHAKEPMYIMVLASLVPEVSYTQIENPVFTRYKGLGSISDMANGMLQNVGPQPVYTSMLHQRSGLTSTTFAYADRFADWMFKPNEVHGEMNEFFNGSLRNFVLQRTFSSTPSFSSQFLEIPTDFLDGVLQFDTSTTGLTYWLDVMFDYKISMPLMEYCIPSLQNPAYEHGKSIVLRKNGQLL